MSDSPVATGRVWLTTLAVAVVAPLLVWLAVDPIAGHRLIAEPGGVAQQVTPVFVVLGALLPTAIGLGIAVWLRRFASGRTVWTVLALVALAGSLLSPLSGTTGLTVVVLMGMHLIVGVSALLGGRALAVRR